MPRATEASADNIPTIQISANIDRPPPLPGFCAIRRPRSHFVWLFCCNCPFNTVYAQ